MQMEVGEILDGRVTGITSFGAFVALPGGKSGLVHISEVANRFVRDVHEFLTEGQEVRVKVIDISPEGKIRLSIRQAEPAPESVPQRRPAEPRREVRNRPAAPQPALLGADGYVPASSGDRSFEDKLKRFMQESDGKMSGNKLFQQQKKGQRHRK